MKHDSIEINARYHARANDTGDWDVLDRMTQIEGRDKVVFSNGTPQECVDHVNKKLDRPEAIEDRLANVLLEAAIVLKGPPRWQLERSARKLASEIEFLAPRYEHMLRNIRQFRAFFPSLLLNAEGWTEVRK